MNMSTLATEGRLFHVLQSPTVAKQHSASLSNYNALKRSVENVKQTIHMAEVQWNALSAQERVPQLLDPEAKRVEDIIEIKDKDQDKSCNAERYWQLRGKKESDAMTLPVLLLKIRVRDSMGSSKYTVDLVNELLGDGKKHLAMGKNQDMNDPEQHVTYLTHPPRPATSSAIHASTSTSTSTSNSYIEPKSVVLYKYSDKTIRKRNIEQFLSMRRQQGRLVGFLPDGRPRTAFGACAGPDEEEDDDYDDGHINTGGSVGRFYRGAPSCGGNRGKKRPAGGDGKDNNNNNINNNMVRCVNEGAPGGGGDGGGSGVVFNGTTTHRTTTATLSVCKTTVRASPLQQRQSPSRANTATAASDTALGGGKMTSSGHANGQRSPEKSQSCSPKHNHNRRHHPKEHEIPLQSTTTSTSRHLVDRGGPPRLGSCNAIVGPSTSTSTLKLASTSTLTSKKATSKKSTGLATVGHFPGGKSRVSMEHVFGARQQQANIKAGRPPPDFTMGALP